MDRWVIGIVLALAVSAALADGGRVVHVTDDAQLKQALADAKPGDTIKLAARQFAPLYFKGLVGAKGKPIVLESADPAKPALFVGGTGSTVHLAAVAWLTIRNIDIRGGKDNGLNLDDGGAMDAPARHVLVENVRVSEIGPKGNHDAIKLSGLNDFEIRDCALEAWGGEGIDMVGCHDGRIVGCSFRGREGFSQAVGIQAKGGSRGIVIERCRFDNAGARAINIGGSTGFAFFRPPVPDKGAYEAKDIVVRGCAFIGNEAPIAFVGCDGATVQYNTFYRPGKWLLRILQETTDPRFVTCRNGVFERNVVVFRAGDLRPVVNIGGQTAPETFTFAGNIWFCADDPKASAQQLPAPEKDGVHGQDPKLKNPAQGDLTVTDPAIAKKAGPAAMPATQPAGE